MLDFRTLKTIGFYTGKIITGIGMLMVIPIITALVSLEWNVAADFLIGLSTCVIIGCLLIFICRNCTKNLSWVMGMVIVSTSWIICMFLVAIPYWLSGHWLSYLDAIFDVMSGFTTTGLALIQDLDHISNGVNMWRHVLSYLGGQGLVVLALIFLAKYMAGAFTLYVGEAKDVRLLPNVINTAKAIWFISLVYLGIGAGILFIAGLIIGIPVHRALLHGIWVFMAAWSTGGFAPQSQSILYYHSAIYEVITVIIFIIGSFNFALHHSLLTGNRKEIYKNIEMVSFFITSTLFVILCTYELANQGVYSDAMSLFRRGFYQLISGHTTTGFMTIYARQFIREWGNLAMIALIISMLIGGSASSTAGGFKGLRIGLVFKALIQDIKRLLLPESAVTVERFHFIRPQILENDVTKSAMLIIILYLLMFAMSVIVSLLYGYPLMDSIFESASVTGNVGLSCGLTSASMPADMKILYIMMMWAARLEFMAVSYTHLTLPTTPYV
jgi:trk system potassium uptake protein TrkH